MLSWSEWSSSTCRARAGARSCRSSTGSSPGKCWPHSKAKTSARSFMRSVAIAACAVVACHSTPEADPGKVVALAKEMIAHVPAPAGVRNCKPDELVGTSLTQLTLLKIAKATINTDTIHAEWINPPQLDAPAARVLADPNSDPTAARQAAAELLAAPFYVVYRVDSVNAPIAVEVKDPKIGTVGARAIRYDK